MQRTSEAATLVNHVGAFDETVDSTAAVAMPATTRGDARSTVLPRVERTGEGATLVSMARPRFETRRALGQGGIGEVVAAMDQDIGREVAIKRLRGDVQGPAAVARFVDEIRTVGALEHPNIVPIHDVGVDDDGSLYFVMRCVQGATLESIIERLQAGDPVAHAHWTHERRVHVFRQLLDAVAFAHERGYVHRDIKPANVMVGHWGEVFLMDWGIAKPVGATDLPSPSTGTASATGERVTATHVGAVLGTPAYMSPEQARGEPVDARSDIYSLCVMLHELLGLKHYLEHCTTVEGVLDGVQHAHASAPSFISNPHQTTTPMDLSWFVLKGVAKEPARRYQSVAEMIERLDAREEGLIPVQCPVTFSKRMMREQIRFIDRHPMVFMAMLGLFVVSTIALGIWRLVA
ncbi:MAG: serine/threonine-protein kinase [Polyangiaceae bacterium]|jgi:serine/threonine protein kinase